MADAVLNPRRAPRIPARCVVQLRHRFATWNAETEDLGPEGLAVVSPRLVPAGRAVKVAIHFPALGRAVEGDALVRWTRATPPSRLGLSFRPAPAHRGFFEALVAADPAAARHARRSLDRLPRRARVYLGQPPQRIVDFTPDELAVLRRVGAGVTVDALVRAIGEGSDRIRGALFGLLSRRMLVLDRAASPGVQAWRAVLAEAEASAAVAALPAAAPRRPIEAERLYQDALGHLAAGRIALGASRLREAIRLSPGDDELMRQLTRIEPWAS